MLGREYHTITLQVGKRRRRSENEVRDIKSSMGSVGIISHASSDGVLTYHIGDSTIVYNFSSNLYSLITIIASDKEKARTDMKTLLAAIQEESPELKIRELEAKVVGKIG